MACLVLLMACLAMASSVLAGPAKLPAGLKICSRNDPALNTCLKGAITEAFPIIAKGLPTLSISSIDPLGIKNLMIGQGTGPVRINLEFTDIQLVGVQDAWIETFKINLDNFKMEGRVRFSSPVRIQGPYKISGSILVLPIVGDGISNITLNDLIADIVIAGDHYMKGGEEFIKIKTFDLSLTVKHLHITFSNLFNGDKTLGDTMNNFLNENWEEIFKELQPAFEETLGATFKQITAQFFRKVPLQQILPTK